MAQSVQSTSSASRPASEKSGAAIAAGTGGIFAAILASLGCVGPLVAIMLGTSGFGWLARFGVLKIPAAIATFAALGYGFYWAYVKKRPSAATGDDPCAGDPCADVDEATAKRALRTRRMALALLWVATVFAVGMNVFEYVIFPRL